MRHKTRKQATRYTRPDYDSKPRQTRQPRPQQPERFDARNYQTDADNT